MRVLRSSPLFSCGETSGNRRMRMEEPLHPLEGVRSARFWSASLFIDEMNGSTLAIDSKA